MVELDKAHEVNNADFDEWHEHVKNIFDIARKEIAIESARSRPFSSRTFGVKSASTRNPIELWGFEFERLLILSHSGRDCCVQQKSCLLGSMHHCRGYNRTICVHTWQQQRRGYNRA